MTRISNVRKTTKFKRSIKAISPVIATLLMIAIAVVASLVVYAWVTGYIGGTTSTAGKAIQIQSFATVGSNLVIYVQNVGQGDVALNQAGSVYVDDNLVSITDPATTQISIPIHQTVQITVPLPSGYNPGDTLKIKVTTTDGTYMTTSGKATSTTIQGVTNLNPTSGQVGQLVTVSGSGFTASTVLSATFDGSTITLSGVTTTDASGAFTGATFTVPTASAGTKTVVFSTGSTSGYSTFIVSSASLATPTVPAPTLNPSGSTTVNTQVSLSTTISGSSGTPTGTALFQVKIGTGVWTDIGTVVTLVSGVASTTYTPTTADSYQFQVIYSGDSTYNGLTSGATALTVSNAASVIDHFTFATISTPQTTGIAYSITITAVDQYGATFTSYTGNPTLTSTSWTGTKQLGAFALGTKTGTVASTITGSTSITATDGSTTGTSNTFTISNASPVLDHFTFDTISGAKTAGTAFSITIRAIDQYGAAFTSYTGTNSLTISSGTMSPTSTTGGFTAGVWTGVVTLYTSGSGITIGTTGNTKTGTSNTITVNAGSGTFGNTNTGTNTQAINNYIRGIPYVAPASGTAQSISAYINPGSSYRHFKAALYTSAGSLIGSTNEVNGLSSGAQWVTFTFSGTKPALTAATTYSLVVWADSGSSTPYIYYSSTSTNVGRYVSSNYPSGGTYPSSVTFASDNYLYCIYCTYSIP